MDPPSGRTATQSGRRQRRTTRASARPWCTGVGHLTAIDSAAPRLVPLGIGYRSSGQRSHATSPAPHRLPLASGLGASPTKFTVES
jgi:hypothetical protein